MRHIVIAILALAAAGCGDRRENGTRTTDLPSRRTTTSVPANPPVTGTYSTSPRVDETVPEKTEAKPKDVDDTGINVRDRDNATVTPTDQKNNDADLTRTADIRKRIVDAKLSTDGTNVKVITQNGRVTLRGPVKSQDEKDTIVRIAREVAGDANVDDELEIESGTGR